MAFLGQPLRAALHAAAGPDWWALSLYAQIERWLYADLLTVEAQGTPLPLDHQLAAFETVAAPERIREIQVSDDPAATTRIEYDDLNGTRAYGYVDPYTGAVLWWPRGRKRLIVVPKGRGRGLWRSTHLFTAMLATVLVVPILITGLPWTDIWDGGLDRVQKATGQSSISLKWGGDPPGSNPDADGPISLDAAIAIARAEGILLAPIALRPSRDGDASHWVGSASTNRAEQSERVIDQYSGAVLACIDFADNPPLAKAVSWGISFHRGEAYGWLNVAQNTLAAVLAVALAVTGFVAWWMRRPPGSLGVP